MVHDPTLTPLDVMSMVGCVTKEQKKQDSPKSLVSSMPKEANLF